MRKRFKRDYRYIYKGVVSGLGGFRKTQPTTQHNQPFS